MVLLVSSGMLWTLVPSGVDTADRLEALLDSQLEFPEGHQSPAPVTEREERTGLTLIQRSPLNRQLKSGGIVNPPVMRQPFGSLAIWFGASVEGSDSVGSTQVQEGGAQAVSINHSFLSLTSRLGGALQVMPFVHYLKFCIRVLK